MVLFCSCKVKKHIPANTLCYRKRYPFLKAVFADLALQILLRYFIRSHLKSVPSIVFVQVIGQFLCNSCSE